MTAIWRFPLTRSYNRLSRLLEEVITKQSSERTLCSELGHFIVKPFKLHRLKGGPSTEVKCSRKEAVKFYNEMVTVRRLEAAANSLYKDKSIRGFCHLYTGQEAVCVGIENAIYKDDAVITAYRAHGWTHVRGVPLKIILSELTGRRSGCSRGKGGSMHLFNKNFYGGHGIVGAQMPLGAGIAFAQKYNSTNEITMALCGDGAINQGQVFEVFNMAKLWSLPVIFVIENNGFGMGTSADRASACTDYYTRGHYIPGVWVDGMDVLAVREATRYLADQCRQGNGPFVMEAATYRYHGHSVSDPGTTYRTREEVQEVRKSSDPIASFKKKICDSGLVSTEELKAMDAVIRKEVKDAIEFAMADPELDVEELYSDVYYKCLEPNIRGCTPFSVNKPPENPEKPYNL